MDNFYENYFNKKKIEKNNLVDNLYKIPKKDKAQNMPRFQVFRPNEVQQADILFLPDDEGYKYCLVVVDSHSKLTDAVPMKTKTNEEILRAFKTIYKRNILKMPLQIEVDSGNEFKGIVSDYFKSHNIRVRVAKPSRHRQQAIVERRNQIIGRALFKRMANQEVLTGETSKEWKDDLPLLIKHMNANTKKNYKPITKIPDKPIAEGDALDLLPIGTKVRVILERPKDIIGDNLHGKFRSGDIRWDPKERIIKDVILKSGYPPMYLLNGNSGILKIEPIGYTKNQLQVISSNERKPSPSLINPKAWRVEKIVNEKKIKGKLYYLVKWRGFPDSDNTWQLEKELKEDLPNFDEMIYKYNNNLHDQSGKGLIREVKNEFGKLLMLI